MARRRKSSSAAAKARKARISANKNLNENEIEEDTSESPSAEDNNEEIPIVHHKKFGEIRVKQPNLNSDEQINGITSNENIDSIKIGTEGEQSGSDEKPLISNADVDDNKITLPEVKEDGDAHKIDFMNVMKGLEMLKASFSEGLVKNESLSTDCALNSQCESVQESENNVELQMDIDKSTKSESPVYEESTDSPKDIEIKTIEIKEEDSTSLEAATIRRSTRIRHIGILKKKEKSTCVSPDVEKPVKVKSRWRRSSELEMHRTDSPQADVSPPTTPEPESQEQLIERLAKEKKDTAEGMRTFVPILENEYRTERNICREAKKMNCDCILSKEELENGEKGCGDDCLNRMLFIECGQKCALGDRCTNKCFQRKSYGLCKIFKTEKKGFGLRAEKLIPGNSFIMEYVGEVVDQKEFGRRVKNYAKDEVKHFYFMALKGDTVIDATSKGNISRFINHSCDPNAETQKWTVNGELRIGFFSKRPIQSGEEITFDYKFQRYGKAAQKCFCEAAQCRGWIGENPDDESDEESEEESDEEEEDADEEDDDDDEEEEEEEVLDKTKSVTKNVEKESEAKVTLGADADDEKREGDMDIGGEAEEKVKRPRKPRARKPKTPAEKKEGRGRGRRKKEEPVVEDLGLEEEIQRLTITGLKNRAHTLMLSRLMIRAEEWSMRSRILHLISTGDEPCRRLFLDYHGLRFLYAWMQAVNSDPTDRQLRRLEILNTLQTLPIPHKTMLIDSKILGMVEEWHGCRKSAPAPNFSPDGDSGESEPTKTTIQDVQEETSSSEMKISPTDSPASNSDRIEACDLNGNEECSKVQNMAKTLLDSWSTLKEVFKIPKKERMIQMKEHEREADRGYRQSTSSKVDLDKIYSRYKIERLHERDREKGRDRRESDRKRSKDGLSSSDPDWLKNHRDRRMTKQERRQMFALQVLREDEAARHRMQQEELWSQHKARCEGLGLDPNIHPAMDPISGCPIFFDHNTRTWAPYPPYNPGPPPPHHNVYSMVPNGLPSAMPYPMVSYPNMNGPYPTPSPSVHMTPIYQSTPPIHYPPNIITLTPEPPPPEPVRPVTEPHMAAPTLPQVCLIPDAPAVTPVPFDAPIKLPPKWKVARDARGYVYYYHIKQRKSQWEPPSWTEEDALQKALPADDLSSSESSESETEEEEDDEVEESGETEMETGEIETEQEEPEDVKMTDEADTTQPEPEEKEGEACPRYSPVEEPSQSDDLVAGGKVAEQKVNSPIVQKPASKRRAGLVQERIISPRYESSRSDSKRYKEIKLMLKKRKEEKRKAEKVKLKGEKIKSKSERKKRKRDKRVTSAVPESSTDKRIKENFKLSIAHAIVGSLNPYRKLDCQKGRITSNDDFKHLARKLTHFVMVKELKHCQSVDDLQCNESVVVKARDFIRKYMSKFGREYERCVE